MKKPPLDQARISKILGSTFAPVGPGGPLAAYQKMKAASAKKTPAIEWAAIYRPLSIDNPPGDVFAVIVPTGIDPITVLHLSEQDARQLCDRWNDRLTRERSKERTNRTKGKENE